MNEFGKEGLQLMTNLRPLMLAICLAFIIGGTAAASVMAQDVQTKGFIGGTVTDPAGAAVPGATVTVTGQTGTRTGTTNDSGIFRIDNLERLHGHRSSAKITTS